MEGEKGKDRGQKNTAHNNTISFVSNVQDWKKEFIISRRGLSVTLAEWFLTRK